MSSLYKREKIDIGRYNLDLLSKIFFNFIGYNQQFLEDHIEIGSGLTSEDPHIILKDISINRDMEVRINIDFIRRRLPDILKEDLTKDIWKPQSFNKNNIIRIGFKNISFNHYHGIILNGKFSDIEFINLNKNNNISGSFLMFRCGDKCYLDSNIKMDGRFISSDIWDENDINKITPKIKKHININNYNNILIKGGIEIDPNEGLLGDLPKGLMYYEYASEIRWLFIKEYNNSKNDIKVTPEMKKYYELDDNKDLNEEDGFEYYVKY